MLIAGTHIMNVFGKLYKADFTDISIDSKDVTNSITGNGTKDCGIDLYELNHLYNKFMPGPYNYFGMKTSLGDIYTSSEKNNNWIAAYLCSYLLIKPDGSRVTGSTSCLGQKIDIGGRLGPITIKKVICYLANSPEAYKGNNPYMGGVTHLL